MGVRLTVFCFRMFCIDFTYIGVFLLTARRARELRDATREVFNKFARDLAQAELKMRKRNETLRVPYTVIYPSKIPAGIAV